MNNSRWGISATLFFLLFSLLYVYHKPTPRIKHQKANFEFTAPQLYDQYQKNETKADQQLLDKVVLIKGTVKTIIAEDNQLSVILDGGHDTGGVVCEMDRRLKPYQTPEPGQVVILKGKCAGMLLQLDVVLTKCVFIT
jgi:hypothetical protein